jgi:hypothetical protein
MLQAGQIATGLPAPPNGTLPLTVNGSGAATQFSLTAPGTYYVDESGMHQGSLPEGGHGPADASDDASAGPSDDAALDGGDCGHVNTPCCGDPDNGRCDPGLVCGFVGCTTP